MLKFSICFLRDPVTDFLLQNRTLSWIVHCSRWTNMKIKPDRCSMNASRMSWKDWINQVQFPNALFDYCSHEISVGESLSLQIKPSELFGTLMKYLPLWVLPCSGLASVAGIIYCHSLLLFAWPFLGAVKIDQNWCARQLGMLSHIVTLNLSFSRWHV